MSRQKTTNRIRGSTPEIEAMARYLRQNMTPAEKKLWEALRGKKLVGLKFRTQHPLGFFILDFYCPSIKLAIEVDGGVHEKQEEYDITRMQLLNDYDIRVIRFRNEEILTDLSDVLDRILDVSKKRAG